jgi:hypothetical protein
MTMIDARNAVKFATDHLEQIKDLMGDNFSNLRLEELELSENREFWIVTLSYDVPYTPSGLERLLAPSGLPHGKLHTKEYKIFNVDAQTGEFRSMKIRSI